jgi:hypothetical protein
MTDISRADMVRIYMACACVCVCVCGGGLSYNIVNVIISSDMKRVAKQYRKQDITNVLSITAATYT